MTRQEQLELEMAALDAARVMGCNCQPQITITGTDPVYRARVSHDAECPLAPAPKDSSR
jgi:hypothetical protein